MDGGAATVAVSVAPIPLPGTTWGRTRAGRAERWGEWIVVGVTMLLVSVLSAGIRHAVATSPLVPAPSGRMVFAPPIR